MKISYSTVLIVLVLLGSLSSCELFGPGQGIFAPASPHEQYARSLKSANLDETALGTRWLSASEKALQDSVSLSVPYRESGYFPAHTPVAVGYKLAVERGDVILLSLTIQSENPAQVFLDVFEFDEEKGTTKRILSGQADSTLRWEVRRSQTHLIRIQPELLRSGRYTLSVSREPLLAFPVQGRNSKQISSFWGANRDGGRRSHEGVDIFAPRQTPALAATDGLVTRVGVNNLGGNHVFVSSLKHGLNLYYAHLDSWNVAQGARVQAGDTLGFIGNTGNARTTGPHLHFGIYESGKGAIDPLPFIRIGTGDPTQSLLTTELLGDTLRLTSASTLRLAPTSKAERLQTLPRHQIVSVIGGTADWVRVRTPDSLEGYVSRSSLSPIEKTLRARTLPAKTVILDNASALATVMDSLKTSGKVSVLGVHESFELIENPSGGSPGWIFTEVSN